MTIEEYIKKSKMSIEGLIEFAKTAKMDANVVRGLRQYIKPYKIYTTPFSKEDYLKHTILIINGKEVRPTEQDVDICIEYLQKNDALICNKTVRETISKYKKGEIDITQVDEKENDKTVEENTESLKKSLVTKILEQQKTIAEQQQEITNLTSKKKEL